MQRKSALGYSNLCMTFWWRQCVIIRCFRLGLLVLAWCFLQCICKLSVITNAYRSWGCNRLLLKLGLFRVAEYDDVCPWCIGTFEASDDHTHFYNLTCCTRGEESLLPVLLAFWLVRLSLGSSCLKLLFWRSTPLFMLTFARVHFCLRNHAHF